MIQTELKLVHTSREHKNTNRQA